MRICFAVMPWHALDFPCLASGILTSIANERQDILVEQAYANIRWSDFLLSKSGGAYTDKDYALMANDFVYDLAGEWAFSSALRGYNPGSIDAYREIFKGSDRQFDSVKFAYLHASEFIDILAREIVTSNFNILALSSTFTQNVACIALAQRVKLYNTDIITVVGGGNCDGILGSALHKNFPFVDYVVRGEGEIAFRNLLDWIIDEKGDLTSIKNLCWRDDQGNSIVNDQVSGSTMQIVPVPEYTDYFEQLSNSVLSQSIRPALIVENARGCWWGQKHHCTFCGLNGSSMAFRSKDQLSAFEQMKGLISKHKVLDIVATDNILDNNYFQYFLPRLAKEEWDVRIQYEIKSNLKTSQISSMSSAGITHVQPGIESLSSRVLKLMRKGVTGAANVQALRDLERFGITASWNYLVGFPGETFDDYDNIIRQIPNLYHLQPPRAGATRISVQRFSPFFNQPELGFKNRSPHPAYNLLYELAIDQIEDLAFFFDTPNAGITDSQIENLQTEIDSWVEAYDGGSTLFFDRTDTCLIVEDRRSHKHIEHEIGDKICLAVFDTLRKSCSAAEIRSKLTTAYAFNSQDVDRSIENLIDLGLVFIDNGVMIGLPVERSRPTTAHHSALQQEEASDAYRRSA